MNLVLQNHSVRQRVILSPFSWILIIFDIFPLHSPDASDPAFPLMIFQKLCEHYGLPPPEYSEIQGFARSTRMKPPDKRINKKTGTFSSNGIIKHRNRKSKTLNSAGVSVTLVNLFLPLERLQKIHAAIMSKPDDNLVEIVREDEWVYAYKHSDKNRIGAKLVDYRFREELGYRTPDTYADIYLEGARFHLNSLSHRFLQPRKDDDTSTSSSSYLIHRRGARSECRKLRVEEENSKLRAKEDEDSSLGVHSGASIFSLRSTLILLTHLSILLDSEFE